LRRRLRARPQQHPGGRASCGRLGRAAGGLLGLELLELVSFELVLLVLDVVAVGERLAAGLIGRAELLDQVVRLPSSTGASSEINTQSVLSKSSDSKIS